jgi:hypothetical protein
VPPPTAAPTAQAPTAPAALSVAADLDLPPNVTVEPNRGLLEIAVGAAHALSVDGVLVGNGPTRMIPLAAGTHAVRVQGAGVDVSRDVEIRPGRRVRLGM